MKKCKKGKRAEELPEELIEEILWRLPMKSMIICGCVCKSWYSLIRTRYFISTHLHKTRKNQPFLYEFLNNQISLIFHKPHKLDYRVLNLPTDPHFTFAVIDSCNGILCLIDVQYVSKFILVNPSIRRSLLLPDPQLVPLSKKLALRDLLGFGFDAINCDYQILRISKSNNQWAAELYSLNSNCWTDIIAPIPNFNFSMGQQNLASFVNGRLHWVVQDATQNINLILVFDLKDHTFHHLSLPKYVVCSQVECLKLVRFLESSIVVIYEESGRDPLADPDPPSWVMREYGAAESWQSISFDELDELHLGCPLKDVNKEFLELIDPSKNSPHLYVPSLELLDKQGSSS